MSEVASTTAASDPEVAALTSRIETALARGRAPSPVESAVEQQSNSQLAEALKTIPKPTAPQQRPAASDTRLALAALPEPTPRSARLPEPAAPAVPESKPVVDSSRFASLDANDASTPSLRQALQPDLIAATASANRLRVPLPSASPANQRIAAAVDAAGDAGDSAQNYDLSLGDLDGRSVKKWAVSVSTRVGPSAVLIAPNYRQGTQQLAPDRVYSAGFARTRFTLRSDSFSGRALTRVAFAKFRNN